ncbi:amidohydrolase family protein [Achlya hypogyna]|uniref:Amidohydrolase family protein n=1 Tax=Achlya hypogyna TaxID=1202772 RepID=A0A1V9YZM1_ACHHY|nr:amidohydrolase family protein [Achlya hypogyna]
MTSAGISSFNTTMAAPVHADMFTRLVALRCHFHEHPELRFQETATQTTFALTSLTNPVSPRRTLPVAPAQVRPLLLFASSCLSSAGLVVNVYGPTTTTTRDGLRCIAFCGDMDTLPITERNPSLAYASRIGGAAHMCGHDGHMTLLAGFACFLQRAALANTCVRLLFQPAEEGHFGAVQMIKDRCIDGVDELYGYHNAPFSLGSVHDKPGAIMSHGSKFTISVNVPGGYSSAPHQTAVTRSSPLGTIVVALQSIASRNVAAAESAIISIGTIHGGEADSAIPSTMRMTGTGVSEAGLPLCASEDFSYYLQQHPGCFFMLGTVEVGEAQNRQLHSDTFDFNDKVLPLAVRLFLEIAQHRLACELFSPVEMAAIYTP